MAKARQRCKVKVKHVFSPEEYREKTQELTQKMRDVELREEQIKAAAANAKAVVKGIKSEISDLRNVIENGGEDREVEAFVEMNKDKETKTFFYNTPGRKETHGKKIRTEPMTEADFDLLPLDETDDKKAKAAEAPAEDPPVVATEPEA